MPQNDHEIHVFLLAHQDDEFAVFQVLEDSVRHGHRPIVLYLTNGSDPGEDSAIRDAESLTVLKKLGVIPEDVHFIGTSHAIYNFQLADKLGAGYEGARETLGRIPNVTRLFMHAWEGGHPDHDAVHAIGVALARNLDLLGQSRQFPVYQGAHLPIGMFRLFAPIMANGPITAINIPWRSRIQQLRLSLSYPSQLRTWVYFFPLLALFMLLRGKQYLQPISLPRIGERPHDGSLLYERRGWHDPERVLNQVALFVDSVA